MTAEEDVTITQLPDYGEMEPSTEAPVSSAAQSAPATEPVPKDPELSVAMPHLSEALFLSLLRLRRR